MDIEVVGDKVPAGCGHRAFYHFPDMGYEVIFIACIAASNGVNLSVGYRKAHGTIQKSSEICFLPAIDCLIYDIIANVVTQIGPFGLIKANLSE